MAHWPHLEDACCVQTECSYQPDTSDWSDVLVYRMGGII